MVLRFPASDRTDTAETYRQLLVLNQLRRRIEEIDEIENSLSALAFLPPLQTVSGVTGTVRRAALGKIALESKADFSILRLRHENDQVQCWRLSGRVAGSTTKNYEHILKSVQTVIDDFGSDPEYAEVEIDVSGGIPLVYRMSKETTEKLKREAKRLSISRNDLLAACVFRGCSKFQDRCGKQSDRDWIRMMVPVNMRNTDRLRQLPACNVVSCVFLDRTPAQIRDMDSLIRSVHEEMDLIKKKELALLFILSLWIRKQTTFRSKRSRINRCQTSIVFSNLGKVFDKSPLCDHKRHLKVGDMTLKSIEAFAPLAPFLHAAFSTLIYGERLSLMLRFDPRFIDHSESRHLLQLITGELDRLVSGESVVT